MGSQSVVVCVAKYPGGKSLQQVLWGPAKAGSGVSSSQMYRKPVGSGLCI